MYYPVATVPCSHLPRLHASCTQCTSRALIEGPEGLENSTDDKAHHGRRLQHTSDRPGTEGILLNILIRARMPQAWPNIRNLEISRPYERLQLPTQSDDMDPPSLQDKCQQKSNFTSKILIIHITLPLPQGIIYYGHQVPNVEVSLL